MTSTTQLAPDLQAQQDIYRAEAARISFPDYCDYVHGRPLYRHQVEWFKEFDVPGAKVLIVAPPVTFKSSTVRMWFEWKMGNNRELAILDVMNTATQSERQVVSISETIENNLQYQKVFPWVVPDKPRGWSHSTLFIARENPSRPDPTIFGTGILGPYQGSHPDIIGIDDPTDPQDVDSPVTIEAQRERVTGMLMDRLEPGGSVIAILTRWGENDLVETFRAMGFTIIENPIEGRYRWGRLLCQEVYPDDRIQAIREMKDKAAIQAGMTHSALFPLTYLCDPQAAVGSIVKRDWWQFYDPATLPKMEMTIHSWDTSTGRKGGNFTAWGFWGQGERGYYLIDAGKDLLTMDELIRKMKVLNVSQEPRAKVELIEDAGTSIPVIQYLQRHTRLPIRPWPPGSRDKKARLQGVVHLIEAKRVWLPKEAPWLTGYINEMSRFVGGSNEQDDYVDMTSQALEFLDRGASGKLSGGGKVRRV